MNFGGEGEERRGEGDLLVKVNVDY